MSGSIKLVLLLGVIYAAVLIWNRRQTRKDAACGSCGPGVSRNRLTRRVR